MLVWVYVGEVTHDIPAIDILEMGTASMSAGVAGQLSATVLGVDCPREMSDSTLAEAWSGATWEAIMKLWVLIYFPSVKTTWEKLAGRKTWRVSESRRESGLVISVDGVEVKRAVRNSDTCVV